MILSENQRIDGRDLNQVRPIDIDLSVLPRAHGRHFYTRADAGFVHCDARSKMDTRMVDDLEGKSFKSFMLDYNFPTTVLVKRVGLQRPAAEKSVTELWLKKLSNQLYPVKSIPYTSGWFPRF